jgi:hypothetical protein
MRGYWKGGFAQALDATKDRPPDQQLPLVVVCNIATSFFLMSEVVSVVYRLNPTNLHKMAKQCKQCQIVNKLC